MTVTNAENALLGAIEQLTGLVAVAMTQDLRQADAIDLLGRSSLSNNQIAAILGTTPDTVRVQRNRSKRAEKRPTKRSPRDGAAAQ